MLELIQKLEARRSVVVHGVVIRGLAVWEAEDGHINACSVFRDRKLLRRARERDVEVDALLVRCGRPVLQAGRGGIGGGWRRVEVSGVVRPLR